MISSVAELPTVTGTCPRPLAAAVRRAVRSGGSWQQTADRVVAALRGHLPGPGQLLSTAQLAGDPSGYQTHLVHAEPDGSFSIVVMVWLPGQETPVHDHLSWCCTAVLQGTEYEEVYAVRGDHLEVVAPQRQPGRHGERLRAARRRPPGAEHRRHGRGLHARLRHRHRPRRLQRPPRLRPPGPLTPTRTRTAALRTRPRAPAPAAQCSRARRAPALPRPPHPAAATDRARARRAITLPVTRLIRGSPASREPFTIRERFFLFADLRNDPQRYIVEMSKTIKDH